MAKVSRASKGWKPLIDSDLANKGVLNSLVRRRRFSDVVLGSWAIVEMNINGVFQLTLGIESPRDKRVRIIELRGLQFDDKIKFLQHVGTITSHEYQAISQFQRDRNDLFHVTRGEMPWFFTITKDKKEEVIGHAWHAAVASNRALVRAIANLQNHPQPVNSENSEESENA